LRPTADVFDEELLVCREPFRVEDGRVLVEPPHLVVVPIGTDDHGRRNVRASRKPPHREINWPSPAKTTASGATAGTYTDT